jgi:hypothetical protein
VFNAIRVGSRSTALAASLTVVAATLKTPSFVSFSEPGRNVGHLSSNDRRYSWCPRKRIRQLGLCSRNVTTKLRSVRRLRHCPPASGRVCYETSSTNCDLSVPHCLVQ